MRPCGWLGASDSRHEAFGRVRPHRAVPRSPGAADPPSDPTGSRCVFSAAHLEGRGSLTGVRADVAREKRPRAAHARPAGAGPRCELAGSLLAFQEIKSVDDFFFII